MWLECRCLPPQGLRFCSNNLILYFEIETLKKILSRFSKSTVSPEDLLSFSTSIFPRDVIKTLSSDLTNYSLTVQHFVLKTGFNNYLLRINSHLTFGCSEILLRCLIHWRLWFKKKSKCSYHNGDITKRNCWEREGNINSKLLYLVKHPDFVFISFFYVHLACSLNTPLI